MNIWNCRLRKGAYKSLSRCKVCLARETSFHGLVFMMPNKKKLFSMSTEHQEHGLRYAIPSLTKVFGNYNINSFVSVCNNSVFISVFQFFQNMTTKTVYFCILDKVASLMALMIVETDAHLYARKEEVGYYNVPRKIP